MNQAKKKYRGYTIHAEPQNDSSSVRGFLFRILDEDDYQLFSLKQLATNVVAAVRYKGEVSAEDLAYRRGIQRVHGKIDVEDYKEGEYTEYYLTMDTEEVSPNKDIAVHEVRAKLLKALMNGRAQNLHYLNEATDVAGFCEALGISLKTFRYVASMLEGEGAIKLLVDTDDLAKGQFYLTNSGVREASKLVTRSAETRALSSKGAAEVSANVRKAVILTALPEEYDAVRAYLPQPKEDVHRSGTIYEKDIFNTPNGPWEVWITQIGAGNNTAAMEAERAINATDPEVAIFVGIAGGIKDVKLGDVVAATKIYNYASGKDRKSHFETRPDLGNSSYALISRARAELTRRTWLQRLGNDLGADIPDAYVAPIAAGEVVVDSDISKTAEFLRQEYGDALAVEMEGRGFLAAVDANEHVHGLVIRGISDLLSARNIKDKVKAARNASAFAFELLSKFRKPGVQVGNSGPVVS
jgi:nucleoside phosphorylase